LGAEEYTEKQMCIQMSIKNRKWLCRLQHFTRR